MFLLEILNTSGNAFLYIPLLLSFYDGINNNVLKNKRGGVFCLNILIIPSGYYIITMYEHLCERRGDAKMGDISSVISKTVQLLIILLIGIYARKRKFITRQTVTDLSKLLSHITSPILIFCSFQRDYDSKLLGMGLYLIAGSFLIHLVSCIIAYFVFKPEKGSCENAVYEFNTVFANCAFMGFPILQSLFGDELGIMYGSFYNTMFNVFLWTYGIVILTRHKGEGKKIDIKKFIFNPGIVGTVLGFILFVCKIKLPATLLGGLKMVGDSTFPIAMIIIGALVFEMNFKKAFRDIKLYICCSLKLIIIPLLVLICCVLFGVPKTAAMVLIILSGMPAATFGAIFAELYEVNSVNAAKIVCITTILSVATIPFVLYITKLFYI